MIRKFTLIPLLLILISGFSFGQNIYPHYQDGRIWFKIKNDVPVENVHYKDRKAVDYRNLDFRGFSYLKNVVENHQVTRLERPYYMVKDDKNLSNLFLLEFSDVQNVEQIISRLKGLPYVEYAEKVPLNRTTLTPNDPSFNSSTQWGLFKIQAPNAWNVSTGSPNVVVAVVDDAVQINHPDLTANIWTNTGEIANNGIDDDGNGYIDDRNGYDVADNDNNPNPPTNSYDHGTHVAGIVGARSNNNVGIASIGYSIKIMAVKATNQVGLVTDGYDGIVYAVQSGADVINMSWGGQGYSTSAQNIINWASNNGVVLIAAAGNDNVNTPFYPAAYNGVISVASTTTNDAKSSFSNFGSWIDVSAPGSSIYSTIPGSSYAYKQGTSMASPMVAGLAGLILSVNPSMTKADVENCILTTADNINSVNSSYIGQLGSGRINAQAAVNCAAATLSLPPVADFSANLTTITAGSSVTFTDLSNYNPTSWSWTFQGGTPGTFSGQNPPAITYNTPGTYNVTLVATNANGSDTETKSAYITVNTNTGCDTLGDKPYDPIYTPTLYNAGPGNGFVAGTNIYGDKAKAEYYNASPYTYITSVSVWFGKRYTTTPTKTVTVFVKDGTSGTPGANLAGGTITVPMSEILADNDGYMFFEFPSPVSLPASKQIFVGVDYSNLSHAAGDSLAIVTAQQNQPATNTAWEQASNNAWDSFTNSWGGNWTQYINAIVTDVPTVATFTESATSLCAGGSINFDATGSTGEDTLLWYFYGGTPYYSNNTQQTVFYNTPGTYKVYLQVIGGACSGYAIDSTEITVLANPSISITSSADTICPGGSANLTASGATSYSWSPGASLSSTTAANPVATPSQTTTYSVTGTTGTCSNSSFITIYVNNISPTAEFLFTEPVCQGDPITFNGAVSDNASSYSWTFQSGSVASSSLPGPVVTWNTTGSFDVTLSVANNCSASDDTTVTINVIDCSTGLGEELGGGYVNGYYDANQQEYVLSFNFPQSTSLGIDLMNSLGQLVHSEQFNTYTGTSIQRIAADYITVGVYFVRVTDGKSVQTFKFVR